MDRRGRGRPVRVIPAIGRLPAAIGWVLAALPLLLVAAPAHTSTIWKIDPAQSTLSLNVAASGVRIPQFLAEPPFPPDLHPQGALGPGGYPLPGIGVSDGLVTALRGSFEATEQPCPRVPGDCLEPAGVNLIEPLASGTWQPGPGGTGPAEAAQIGAWFQATPSELGFVALRGLEFETRRPVGAGVGLQGSGLLDLFLPDGFTEEFSFVTGAESQRLGLSFLSLSNPYTIEDRADGRRELRFDFFVERTALTGTPGLDFAWIEIDIALDGHIVALAAPEPMALPLVLSVLGLLAVWRSAARPASAGVPARFAAVLLALLVVPAPALASTIWQIDPARSTLSFASSGAVVPQNPGFFSTDVSPQGTLGPGGFTLPGVGVSDGFVTAVDGFFSAELAPCPFSQGTCLLPGGNHSIVPLASGTWQPGAGGVGPAEPAQFGAWFQASPTEAAFLAIRDLELELRLPLGEGVGLLARGVADLSIPESFDDLGGLITAESQRFQPFGFEVFFTPFAIQELPDGRREVSFDFSVDERLSTGSGGIDVAWIEIEIALDGHIVAVEAPEPGALTLLLATLTTAPGWLRLRSPQLQPPHGPIIL